MDSDRMSVYCRLLVLSALLIAGEPGHCDDQLLPRSRGDAITLQGCRVTLLQRAVLACEQSGVLDEIPVQDGDVIEADQLVARVRDRLARAATATAAVRARNDVELRYAEKVSELARLEYAGALKLNDEIKGAHSEFQVRNLQVAAQRAALQVEQATHQLEIARIEHEQTQIALDGYSVKSPFKGIVLRVHKVVGEAVQSGEPIAELGNPDVLRVEGFLPLASAWQVRRGQPVEVRVSIPKLDLEVERHSFPGKIVFVDTEIQDVSQQVRVWAKVANSRGLLKAGLNATMQISTDVRVAGSDPIDRLSSR